MSASRTAAHPGEGTVLFVVGMRVNKLWAIHKWLPVTMAMPRMLIELMRNRELGMIGTPRTFVSGRIVMVQQYWSSYPALEDYAKSPQHSHLPAWRAFNKRARGNAAVGIFHETYVVHAGQHENIYVNLPAPILMGAAVGVAPIGGTQESSRQRMQG